MEPTPPDKSKEDPKVLLRRSLDDAFTAYVRDRHEAAREMYSAIIGTDPENKEAFFNVEARFWRGLITGHMGKSAKAERDFSMLIELGEGGKDPTSYARGIAGLSFIHFKQERYEDAQHDAENALEEKTNDPYVHCILGDAYWGMGRNYDTIEESDAAITEYKRAIEQYKTAVNLDRRCFFAQDSIGFVEWYTLLGKWKKSEEEGKSIDKERREDQARSPIRQYKRALETRPDYVNALWNLAMVYAKIGNGKGATEQARLILSYNADHERAKDIISTASTIKLKAKEEE